MNSPFTATGLSALLLYFAYHAFAGDNGLGKWSDMQRDLRQKSIELEGLEAEIERLEADIARLTPGNVDPDFVEALAREKLAFVYPDEIVLMDPSTSSAY